MRYPRDKCQFPGMWACPLLALPLCAVGCLVVVLVTVHQHAPVQASEKRPAEIEPPPEPDPQLAQQREDLDWQIGHLNESRNKTATDLENERLKLAHIEDHVRRLRDEMRRMADAAEQLERLGDSTAEQRAQSAADLARLRQLINQAVAELDEARRKTASPSYAIIPYEGPNRTRRRPIFIECREDAVILQPEGVELSPADFSGPLGPGNPLASALRAAREHLAHSAGANAEGDPYPLLLVRPSGVTAYYKVREAIESWGSDFGYELIGDEWKLAFPPPDPVLADVERRAAEQGRINEARLAASAPSRYGRKPPTYRAAPHRGGFIREDGNGGSGEDGFGGGPRPPQGNARGTVADRRRSGTQEDGRADGAGSPQPSNASAGNSKPDAGSRMAQASQSKTTSQHTPGGAPGGSAPVGTREGSGGSSSSGAGRPGGAGSELSNQARSRGSNWALPDATRAAVPVSRPVRVLCRADRIAILPERGDEGGKLVMLPGPTDQSLDEFVSAMWEHMKGWGIAGNGLYWRPILLVQVGPDGAQRAADLKALLEDSGIEYRDAKDQAQKSPKINR